jgi:hypothetical protein
MAWAATPEEVGAALPPRLFLVHQPEVGFMDERRGLQRMARTLAAHVTLGHPAQLPIDERHEFVERDLVPVAPVNEPSGHVLCRERHCFILRRSAEVRCRPLYLSRANLGQGKKVLLGMIVLGRHSRFYR